MGTLAMIAGSLVGMYFVTVAAMPISVKYGIDTIAACKPQYGSYGSAFGIFAQYTSIIGWNCILIIILGRTTANVLEAANVIHGGSTKLYVSIAVTMVTLALIYWMVARGSTRCATTRCGSPWRCR